MPKHALPLDHDMAAYWYSQAINNAVQEDRKRILQYLQTLRCPADKREHDCDAWFDSKRPPSPSDIAMIINDEYWTTWDKITFEDSGIEFEDDE